MPLLALRTDTPFPIVEVTPGVWYYLHNVYSYPCMIIGISLLILHIQHVRVNYRLPLISMIMGLTIPPLGSAIYLLGNSPYGLDLAPIFLGFSSLFQGFAILTLRMFTMIPIAKEKIFDSMRDAVIILDSDQRLLEYNHAASTMFPILIPKHIGKKVDQLLTDFPNLLSAKLSEQHEFNVKSY